MDRVLNLAKGSMGDQHQESNKQHIHRLTINRPLMAQTLTDGQRTDPGQTDRQRQTDRQTDRLLNLAKGSMGDQHQESNKQYTHRLIINRTLMAQTD